MTCRYFLLVLFLFSFSFGQSQTVKKEDTDSAHRLKDEINKQPNFNYYVEVPADWTARDTTMQDGMKIRFLVPPTSLKEDYPAGNILIAGMNGKNINDFVTANINYLRSNMPDNFTILERGNIDSTIYNGQWFTYTREKNGITRDMINYIIPSNGFAYMITFGTKPGTMIKYRETFDKIARSFKD